MSSYVITLPSTPVNVACSSDEDSLAILFADGEVQVWELNTKVPDPKSGSKLRGGGKVADPQLKWTAALKPRDEFIVKQIAFAQGEVAILAWDGGEKGAVVISARDGQVGSATSVDGGVERLLPSEKGWLVLDRDGIITPGDFEWIHF